MAKTPSSYTQMKAIFHRDGIAYGETQDDKTGRLIAQIVVEASDCKKVVGYGGFYFRMTFDVASGELLKIGIYE